MENEEEYGEDSLESFPQEKIGEADEVNLENGKSIKRERAQAALKQAAIVKAKQAVKRRIWIWLIGVLGSSGCLSCLLIGLGTLTVTVLIIWAVKELGADAVNMSSTISDTMIPLQ